MKSTNISWSRIREWLTCKWRYNLTYEQYLQPIVVEEPLYYGSAFHEILEYIYSEEPNEGRYKRRTEKNWKSKLRRMGFEGEDFDTMAEYINRYMNHIQAHPSAEPRSVIATEFPFEVDITDEVFEELGPTSNLTRRVIKFIGIIDLIVARRRLPEIWDHKLQSNHPRTGELDHPSISYPQMGIYGWASSRLGHFIPRSVLNIYGKRRKAGNVQRYPLKMTEQEAENWGNWLVEIICEMLTTGSRAKSLGSMPCGFCRFRYPCSKDQAVGSQAARRVLNSEYEKKKSKKGGMPRWQSSFSPDILRQLEEAIR